MGAGLLGWHQCDCPGMDQRDLRRDEQAEAETEALPAASSVLRPAE